ncbi:binding-protein-dependent transport systems inner membrane component [Rhodomicrobium vannielii ATCC 17100]|uniref:Binding-protein-dependent transport systems inner membrane component n=1 Tax=Rhodomicrobium vannielii (strain ATCC 17100 / DSM 162 / LMG 4299 / NCIMB 10020 / ATH 3.1.1) TaxID=648757 RepID=E3I4Q7_RHOVT|nr:ABC transporter permease [Rhodomicrobium vannielii]ADP72729.1 binding-protein-dependent transport systems inner membrane component [Rhodomicrobium vannielii ATCC 17100]
MKRSHLLGLIVPAGLLAAWTGAARFGLLPAQILPDPALVAQTIGETLGSGELWMHLSASLQRIAVGFALGAVAGLLLGAAIGASPSLRALFRTPFLVMTQLHALAMLPLIVLVFGIDEEMKLFVIGWATFIPVVLNTAQGIREVCPAWLEVGRVLGFDPWYQATRVVLPAAAPSIFTGIREGLANAWQALILAELFASSEGLGYLIVWGRQLFQLDLVLTAILTIALVGLLLNGVLGIAERRLYRWRGGVA